MNSHEENADNLIEAFHDAIRHGDVAAVKSMLESQPKLANKTSNKGEDALMVAAISLNAVEMMHTLIERGSSLDARGDDGRSVLLFAAENSVSPEAWDYLIQEKRRLDAIPSYLGDCIVIDLVDRVDGILDEALRLAVNKCDWKCTEHLLAQHDMELRLVRVLKRLEEIIRKLDACIVHEFLRLPAVQSTFRAATRPPTPCQTSHDIVKQIVSRGSIQLLVELEQFDIFRNLIFAYCHSSPASVLPMWVDVMKKCRQDEMWTKTWIAFWVQRRKMGRADHMGQRIAQFLYVFDGDKIVQGVCPQRFADDSDY
ncbi:hypothetical protein AeMF1_012578 [Aphanomyces euteiches]|nr:hypothetical protein AeMF1_012578 [Aphanomyces euteiches]KAH9187986.1 hypothetical protein AeNC1_010038 [Aphanomyces euteiches]